MEKNKESDKLENVTAKKTTQARKTTAKSKSNKSKTSSKRTYSKKVNEYYEPSAIEKIVSFFKERWYVIFVVAGLIISNFVIPGMFEQGEDSNDEEIVAKGEQYILERISCPSSAVFQSYYDSDTVEELLKSEWNYELERGRQIMMYTVSHTDAYGERKQTSYLVFFREGKPVGMENAAIIDQYNIRSIMDLFY